MPGWSAAISGSKVSRPACGTIYVTAVQRHKEDELQYTASAQWDDRNPKPGLVCDAGMPEQ
jgi:hypothetical protein